MPGLLQGSGQSGNSLAGALTSSGIWSKRRDEITFDQIHKYWSALPIQARHGLLRIDKQTLFEQARKNLYCSRCNGLLLEGYSQIVMYGKSMQQQEGEGVHDPSLHSWGGLATTRDGMLTLLDYFLKAKSLRVLQDVFDNARARERERELLYPDACGGGGRGWISQGMANYGRGYGMRDTCALHTARLSCDTLVDFWSALSDETRSSLLRMKEEDFMERLMYRFDSKRFCRDCRRNVILEFKELKELKRMRREPRCSSWFCVADTAFQYEVSWDAVHADWRQTFSETVEKYHHFEWAIGTGEGKSDILDFEDVGMNGKVQVNGLDLGGLSACYITLRAWKLDGRCTELCVKAHALNGQPCVHRKLTVGDGFVTITAEESIRSFFEHAEEVEEEEDDDSFDKDGNEFDGDGSRSQKHAKSPELAREFLLDAATVIFKEQVEKAFREGTARQNAHSMFVCLSLNLLEERIHVACKEIITLEKQIKLLEEEEKEKQEEDERKERRRTREREKKFRRKERLKGREREREREHIEQNILHLALPTSNDDLSTSTHDDSPKSPESGDSISVIESGDTAVPASTISPDCTTEQSLDSCIDTKNLKTHSLRHQCHDDEIVRMDRCDSFILEQSKSSRRKLRSKRDFFIEQAPKWYDKNNEVISEESTRNDQSDVNLNGCVMTASRCIHGVHRPSKERVTKTDPRNCNPKVSEKFHCLNGRKSERYEFQPYSYSQRGSHRPKDGYHNALETQRPLFQGSTTSLKGKPTTRAPSRDAFHMKQVWEPMDARKKCIGSNSDLNVTLKTPVMPEPIMNDHCSSEPSENACESNALGSHKSLDDSMTDSNESDLGTLSSCQRGFELTTKSSCYSKDGAEEEVDSIRNVSVFPLSSGCDTMMRSSSSDNCSSCLSEGGSSTSSSSAQNADSSSTSDSEDAVQQSAVRSVASDRKPSGDSSFTSTLTGSADESCTEPKFSRESSNNGVSSSSNKRYGFEMASSQQHALLMHNQGAHVPIFPTQTMGYLNQSGFFWSASPNNGLFPYPQANQYVFPGLGNGLTQTPVLSVPQHSFYQAATVPHIASSDRAQQTVDSVHPFERPCSKGQQLPSEKPVAGQKGSANDASKPKEEISSFSLFHFGGPVTGVAGSNMKAQASCSMEDATIVEYSLFAASGGVRFSFF